MPPFLSVRARCRRFISPPERSATRFCWSAPLKLNIDDIGAGRDLALSEEDPVLAARDLVVDGFRRVGPVAVLVYVGGDDGLADGERARRPVFPAPRSS